MGYKELDVNLPLQADESELKARIAKETRLKNFRFEILKKSLDARKKDRIVWSYRVGIISDALVEGQPPKEERLKPNKIPRAEPVVVVGTGPAGIFAADWLSRSGFSVTVVERGSLVQSRKTAIQSFESGGDFDPANNYSFGEGGAGTFSDGKLSSRSKGISLEKDYIFNAFIQAGAPKEINWLTHPHVGSDLLYTMTQALRKRLENQGVTFLFDTMFTDVVIKGGRVIKARTSAGDIDCSWLVVAAGHSAMETQRVLIAQGVQFQSKNFALGFRAEHPQALINEAQWGHVSLPGVKAAEYRLTAQGGDGTGVYSFCMCPGGMVVPAAAYPGTNIVNGMSEYARNREFANAAVVAGINLERLFERPVEPLEALDWLSTLEETFYQAVGGYKAPAMGIADFIKGSGHTQSMAGHATSYPLGLADVDLGTLVPPLVAKALREGLVDFSRKLKGYDTGIILGLESKTSASIQVVRDPETLATSIPNLFVAGEGGGWSGGIVSSAADGLRVAQKLCELAI